MPPNRAGVDSLGDAMGAAQVLRPDAGRQAVVAIVGVIDHFFFVVEWRDCHNRTEDFFAIRPACHGQTADDSWRVEISLAAPLVRRIGRFTA
jgi:hypothetical protein